MIREVELKIPGELKDEPIFYFIIKHFDVIPSIIEASFSTDMGWAIVAFKGEEPELENLFNFLKDKGIEVVPRN